MVRKIFGYLESVVFFLEKSQLSITTWIVSFSAIIATRFVVEGFMIGLPKKQTAELVGSLFHGTFLFFLCSYLLLLIVLFFVTKEKITKLVKILLWGQWLIVLPPIIDKIIFRDRPYWSFYLFDGPKNLLIRFFEFFGENPAMGITWGTRFVVLLSVLILGWYVYLKKRKISSFFVGVFFVYLTLFFLACVPSLISFVIIPFQGVSFFDIQSHHVAKIFLTENIVFGIKNSGVKIALQYKLALFYDIFLFFLLVVLQYIKNKRQFFAILKNIRFPQMIFNWGLFFVGVGLGWFYFPKNFSLGVFPVIALLNAGLAIFYAWTYSVFVNDLADIKTDEISNNSRPLVQRIFDENEYFEYAIVFGGLALISSIVVSTAMFGLVAAYLLITWVYSCHPFRLKRFVFVASFLSSFVSLFFLVAGYLLLSNNQSLEMFPWRIVLFLFVVYALVIPVKDLKDVEGDKASDVFTLPVLLGEENARLVLGGVLFLCYLLSPYVVKERSLFLTAFLFGTISFWTLVNKKINSRILPWWVLAIVFVYGIVLVMKLFG